MVEAAILGDTSVLGPLRALEPELDLFAPMTPGGLSEIHNDPKEPVPAMTAHRFLSSAPPNAVAALVAAAGPGSGSPLVSVELRHLGGALARPGTGALDMVDGNYSLFAVGIAPDAETAQAVDAALATVADALAPWDTGRFFDDCAPSTACARSHPRGFRRPVRRQPPKSHKRHLRGQSPKRDRCRGKGTVPLKVRLRLCGSRRPPDRVD